MIKDKREWVGKNLHSCKLAQGDSCVKQGLFQKGSNKEQRAKAIHSEYKQALLADRIWWVPHGAGSLLHGGLP